MTELRTDHIRIIFTCVIDYHWTEECPYSQLLDMCDRARRDREYDSAERLVMGLEGSSKYSLYLQPTLATPKPKYHQSGREVRRPGGRSGSLRLIYPELNGPVVETGRCPSFTGLYQGNLFLVRNV